MLWSIVAVFAAACIGSTVAPAPCSKYPNIPCLLRKFEECYDHAQPPPRLAGYDIQSTVLYASPDLFQKELDCVIGTQIRECDLTYGLVDRHFKNGSCMTDKYPQTLEDSYISEEDDNGYVYKIFIIHNSWHVYFYYRCIVTEGVEGTGQPMFVLWVECGYEYDCNTIEQIEKAKKCAEKLNVELVKVKPCDCECGC